MNEILVGWAIGLHLLTFHAGVDRTKGDTVHEVASTPGIYAVAPSGLTLGAYRSSLSGNGGRGEEIAAYVGWTWRATDALWLTGGIGRIPEVNNLHAMSPILAVSYRIGEGPFAPRIMWAPQQRVQPISLAWEVRF